VHDAPQHIVGDPLVLMAQYIANARHFRPRNFRMLAFHLIVQMPAGLRDDFDAALDQPSLAYVGFQAQFTGISSTASMMSVRRAIGDGAGIRISAAPSPRSARAELDASCAAS
jgi:hypothetical protein